MKLYQLVALGNNYPPLHPYPFCAAYFFKKSEAEKFLSDLKSADETARNVKFIIRQTNEAYGDDMLFMPEEIKELL